MFNSDYITKCDIYFFKASFLIGAAVLSTVFSCVVVTCVFKIFELAVLVVKSLYKVLCPNETPRIKTAAKAEATHNQKCKEVL